jgi:uncharacterized protein (DUF2141 family)
MRKLFAIYLLLAPLSIICAQSTLTVEIVNLESNKGRVIVALIDENEKDVTDQSCKIDDNKCTVTFNDVKHNRYAVRFFHDENENKELDTNFLGIPKEGFGFSNDAMGKFGPKKFGEWLFDLSRDTTIKITTNYL